MKTRVVIIGAGPAGLTAGYLLSKEEVDVVVLEADPVYVGGISRTATYKGFHFDIGGAPLLSNVQANTGPSDPSVPYHRLRPPPSLSAFFPSPHFAFTS